ncbi:MAG: TetR/AcrR family transcriptional regulator [Novosphingobium sp.]|uniref:TetR/AcrR family transcriptional regulator n=1 Tax=Novosphingobium sp. TaxID=1874826 RepID=UPI0032B980A6
MITVSTSKSYHHGDLRAALVEAGLKALEAQDISEIALRQLAREVGVSPTAVYRHFPDKNALMAALAQAGIEQMAAWQAKAAAATGPEHAFAATGRAYVRWALAHPALFKLVFSQCREVGQTVFGNNGSARMLRQFATELTGDEAGAQRLMLQAWALVHGLAMLMLDGQLPHDEALIDQVIDAKTLFRP